MKILMMPFSAFLSHTIRLLDIAKELRKNGHDVTFAVKHSPLCLIDKQGFERVKTAEISKELFDKLLSKFMAVDTETLHKMVEADIRCIDKINPDIIISDVVMPVMNGIETTEHIRNKMPYPKNLITVIALTAHNPALFIKDFSCAGFDDLITKPYSLDKITNLINNLC